MTTTTAEAPKSRYEMKVGDETREVFMSFALLNELTPLVGGPERMAEFDFDAILREHTVLLCLGQRDERKKLVEDQILPELDLDATEGLLDWVKEHVLSFFLRRLMKNIEAFDKNAEALRMSARLGTPQTR
jgi:hypothetical protein